MCYVLDRVYQSNFMRAWALDRFGIGPDYGTPGSGFFVRPLTNYTVIYCPSHVFDEAYSTRIIFLELLAILADEGWTADDATKKMKFK